MARYRGEGPELSNRLDEAERHERCLLARNSTDGRRLSRLCEGGLLVRPVDGLYARTSTWDRLDPVSRNLFLARSLSERHGEWVFSHTSAAVLYGLSVGYAFLDKVHVITCSGCKSTDVVIKHRMSRGVRELDGIKVTSPEDTVLDCAVLMPFPDALAVADSAIASRLTCERNLRNASAHRVGFRGIRAGRRVVSHVDGRAESGGESVVRGILIELGYEVVDIQVPVKSIEGGKAPLRLDILLHADDGSYVDLEVDGSEKYENPSMNGGSVTHALTRERQREAGITALGYKVMRASVVQARDREWLKARLGAYGVSPRLSA